MPTFKLGLMNYWLLLAAYAALLFLSISRLSRSRRDWLFEDPKRHIHGIRKIALRLGQVVAVAFIVLIALTPLPRAPSTPAVLGLALFLAGTLLVVVSIHFFGAAPEGRPAREGPYRVSRNPQWVGLFLALLGLAISSSSWVLTLMVTLVGLIYHIQILAEEEQCRDKYGASYDAYIKSVPRYLAFL